MRGIILCFIFFSQALFVQAGVIRWQHDFNWNSEYFRLQTGADSYIETLSFSGATHPESVGYLPYYVSPLPLRGESIDAIRVINATYENVVQVKGALKDNPQLGGDIDIQYTNGLHKKQPVGNIYFVPMRRDPLTGQVQQLKHIELEVVTKPVAVGSRKSSGSYTTNSVLSSGTWYKIAVSEEGVYKLDFNFLQNLGIKVGNIDPRNIRIYGNGGGMLPEANSEFRYDDLQENAIAVVGEGDGKFDQGDYVLFYGQSPHRWKQNGSVFEHQYNIYSDKTYYFITVDKGTGKRIGAQAQDSNAKLTVTSFNDYDLHKIQEENLLESGRLWLGDKLNFAVTNQEVTFDFPNVLSNSPVNMRTSMVARSVGQSATFTVKVNGATTDQITIDGVSGAYLAKEANSGISNVQFNTSSSSMNIDISMSGSSSAEGWIDFIELNALRALSMTGDVMFFRSTASVGAGNSAIFKLSNAGTGIEIWEVTDALNVKRQNADLSGSEIQFKASTSSLREYVALRPGGNLPVPEAVGRINNQNLHGTGDVDMVIVTSEKFASPAATLAAHHRNKQGLDVAIVTIDQLYNEFSSGAQDLTAIRDFMKMLYDRAGTDPSKMPSYLLLLGDASFDYKNIGANNTNVVPTYESEESFVPVRTFCTDDYFGLLDDTEGGSLTDQSGVLDVAIGRIPVNSAQEASDMVSKILNYQSTNSLGNWRNVIAFVADDEDGSLHLNQADELADTIVNNFPEYNIDKIYLDAYEQESTPGGSRYPSVKEAINRRMYSGALIMNYTGHGGVNGWAHERVVDISDINSWVNFDKLPLFVTATCEFSKYDSPAKASAGEQVLLNADGGAIAMVTTVRVVFSGDNMRINQEYLDRVFSSYNGRYPTMGEALMISKNALVNKGTSIENSRKFVLLGDPAIPLAYPRYEVVTTHIDGNDITVSDDTLKALQKVTIKGQVRDDGNAKMGSFNGIVYPTIYDKSAVITTLKNDPGSTVVNFDLQKNIVYKGKASVKNGEFSYTFVVPKDISYNFGSGKISYYADNGIVDANGYTNDFIIGGTTDNFAEDNEGPEIDVFMNDEKFVFGGITDPDPLMLIKLSDFSGINTAGNGIGHDITAVLDDDTKNTYVLNEFYEAELDDYQKGEARYPLSGVEEGRHKLEVKAWDAYNNSSEGYTEFVVAATAEIALRHVLNYPNPFTTSTDFQFEHNKPGVPLFVQVKIFTLSGKLVKNIQQSVLSDGFRVDNIHWDGLDEFGDKIGRGAYIYKLSVSTPEGISNHQFEKLVILR